MTTYTLQKYLILVGFISWGYNNVQ